MFMGTRTSYSRMFLMPSADGKPGTPTEMDALIAYLQMLGTLVDFKLYNEKANLR